jgi:hypothetical protein
VCVFCFLCVCVCPLPTDLAQQNLVIALPTRLWMIFYLNDVSSPSLTTLLSIPSGTTSLTFTLAQYGSGSSVSPSVTIAAVQASTPLICVAIGPPNTLITSTSLSTTVQVWFASLCVSVCLSVCLFASLVVFLTSVWPYSHPHTHTRTHTYHTYTHTHTHTHTHIQHTHTHTHTLHTTTTTTTTTTTKHIHN